MTIELLTDAAERQLDELGLEQASISPATRWAAGWRSNSPAAAGRSRSAPSRRPASGTEDWAERERVFEAPAGAPSATPAAGAACSARCSRSRRFRRWALSDVAVHGDRVSREDMLDGGRRHDRLLCRQGADRPRTQPRSARPRRAR